MKAIPVVFVFCTPNCRQNIMNIKRTPRKQAIDHVANVIFKLFFNCDKTHVT